MKNIVIIALGVWVWLLYRERRTAPAGPIPAPTPAGAASGVPIAAKIAATAGEMIRQTGPSPVLAVYGNYSNPASAQGLTLELLPSDAQLYAPGESVKIENSQLYPLYYRVKAIEAATGGNTAITLDTLFVGADVSDIFVSHEGNYISGFGAQTTRRNKGAFL